MFIEDLAAQVQRFALVAGLGRLTATMIPAEERPGMSPHPARLYIATEKPRPANMGGGVVAWTGYINVNDEIVALNGLLSLVCEVITEAGRTAATVRNVIVDKQAAELKYTTAKRRLRATLTGRVGVTGDLFVRREADGSVWLLDPDKREAGFGFRFGSLDELWRTHPELRPIRWGADERGPFLIVASMAMEA
jgi:hypothetical protein